MTARTLARGRRLAPGDGVRLAILLAVAACTTTSTEPLDPLDPYGPDDPVKMPWLAATDGAYYTQTTVEIASDLDDTTLHAYAADPGTTLFAIAETAQLSALAELEDALSPEVFAQVPAWYDATVHENVLGLLGVHALGESLRMLPARVLIESELVLAGDTASHTLEAIYFDVQELGDRFDLGERAGEIAYAESAVAFTPTPTGGSLELAPHELVVALGAYHYELTDARAADRGGVRGTVGELTMCSIVATGVANKCGLETCTAAIPTIAELCERGLDEIVAATRDEVSAVTLGFGGGSANLIDDDGDATADALVGLWNATSTFPEAHLPFHARRPLP